MPELLVICSVSTVMANVEQGLALYLSLVGNLLPKYHELIRIDSMYCHSINQLRSRNRWHWGCGCNGWVIGGIGVSKIKNKEHTTHHMCLYIKKNP